MAGNQRTLLVETPFFRWALQAIALFVLIMQSPHLWHGLNPTEPTPPGDFGQDWCSAKNYWEGFPIYESMYESVPRYIYSPKKELIEIPLKYNAHPPASVLFMLPWGWLGYWKAIQLWAVMSVILILASILIIFHELKMPFRWWYILPILALFLLLRPFYYVLLYGQWEGVLLFLMMLAWLADRRGFSNSAGIFAGLAASLKMFPLFLVVYFACQKRWNSLISMLLVIALLNLLAIAMFGFSVYPEWLHIVQTEIQGYKCAWTNHSLSGFCTKLFAGSMTERVWPISTLWITEPKPENFSSYSSPRLATTLSLLFSCLVVLVYVLAGKRASLDWRNKSLLIRPSDRHFALAILCMSLLSPVSWSHAFAMLILPALILWSDLKHHPIWCLLLTTTLAILLYAQGIFFDWSIALKGTGYIASPWMVLSLISLDFYALMAMWLISLRFLHLQSER